MTHSAGHTQIRVKGRLISLGCRQTGEEAARDYDLVALKARGRRAITNFPRSEYRDALRANARMCRVFCCYSMSRRIGWRWCKHVGPLR